MYTFCLFVLFSKFLEIEEQITVRIITIPTVTIKKSQKKSYHCKESLLLTIEIVNGIPIKNASMPNRGLFSSILPTPCY